MIRRPPRSTHCISSAASDVYKRQHCDCVEHTHSVCVCGTHTVSVWSTNKLFSQQNRLDFRSKISKMSRILRNRSPRLRFRHSDRENGSRRYSESVAMPPAPQISREMQKSSEIWMCGLCGSFRVNRVQSRKGIALRNGMLRCGTAGRHVTLGLGPIARVCTDHSAADTRAPTLGHGVEF